MIKPKRGVKLYFTVPGVAAGAALFALAACALTPAQTAAGVTQGQLFCAKATTAGAIIEAMTDAVGVPVIVAGLPAAIVAAVCSSVGAVPVSPPLATATVPVVAAPVTIAPATSTAPASVTPVPPAT